MKILALDIETSPNVVYTWGLWDQNVGLNQVLETTKMLCFAARFLDERKMHFHSIKDDILVGPDAGAREAMVTAAHDLLDQADAVVHWNGKRFDIPHLNREFLELDFEPPSPYKQIDLLPVVRRNFKFPSYKLEHIATELGVGSKVKHEGFGLWRGCLDGDELAWKRMEKYNRQDVVLLGPLHDILLPWIPNYPSVTLYDGTTGCPRCGADRARMIRRGMYRTKVTEAQQWQCKACGGYTRSSRAGAHVSIPAA